MVMTKARASQTGPGSQRSHPDDSSLARLTVSAGGTSPRDCSAQLTKCARLASIVAACSTLRTQIWLTSPSDRLSRSALFREMTANPGCRAKILPKANVTRVSVEGRRSPVAVWRICYAYDADEERGKRGGLSVMGPPHSVWYIARVGGSHVEGQCDGDGLERCWVRGRARCSKRNPATLRRHEVRL